MNPPSSAPSARPLPLKPRWVAVGVLLLVAYLLLRPWLVERYGWDLPGFTDAKPKSEANAPDETVSPRPRNEKSRPVDVPVVSEQEETGGQVAESDAPLKSRKSPSDPSHPEAAQPARPSVAKSVDKQSDPASSSTVGNTKPKSSTPTAKPSSMAVPKPVWKGLHSIGRGKFESPAGLVYDQYRIDHVMEHTKDNTDKPSHGVFTVTTQDEVLALIDEAFELTQKRGPPQVISEDEGDRTAYTVNLNRQVGRAGGQSGARRRNPPLQKVKIVVEDTRVITAYPTN